MKISELKGTENLTISQPGNDFEPICLRGKYWKLFKLNFVEAIDS